jgi:hypothetical protein
VTHIDTSRHTLGPRDTLQLLASVLHGGKLPTKTNHNVNVVGTRLPGTTALSFGAWENRLSSPSGYRARRHRQATNGLVRNCEEG